MVTHIKILAITSLILFLTSCGAKVQVARLDVKPDFTVIKKIESHYPVYPGSFENLLYQPRLIIQDVPEGQYMIEVSGSIFVEGENPELVMDWYIKQAIIDGWGSFAGKETFVPFDKIKNRGFMSLYKNRRTLSLDFITETGWGYTRIAYLGIAYAKDHQWETVPETSIP